MAFRYHDGSPPRYAPGRTLTVLLRAFKIPVERQSGGCGGNHRHDIAGIPLLRLHRFRSHGLI